MLCGFAVPLRFSVEATNEIAVVTECADFGWGGVNFLPRGCYDAVFWICAEHRVDNMKMFLLLLRRGYTEPKHFLLFMLPCFWRSWGRPGRWEETQDAQVTPTGHRDVRDGVTSCSVYKGGKKEGQRDIWMMFAQVTIIWDGALLSWKWNGWALACPWEDISFSRWL